ncbi:WD40/YVTN/BNR-like repeat-containing protein [Halobium salinum]|uniref:WD40/YVTN/BNR-like repeat-containing protein n=1 Tax=Halobium salinum TaxID=1364940 RepID=A0ABD5PBR4_9EURY|nr:hypothetical protein [Halobium salinum]
MATAYVPLEEALFVVDGAPEDPELVGRRLTDYRPDCVVVHPDRPDRVLVGTSDAGLWRSDDGAESFERVGDGVLHERVTALAVNPGDPDELWAGTEPSAVYRSTDGGRNWEEKGGLTDLDSADSWSFPPRPHTHHVRWIEPDPGDPAHLYVGVEAGALVQTHDRGETWEDRVDGSRRDNHSLATHPDAPSRAWAAAGDGYAESHDGGETWDHPQAGLEHRYCWSVAVDADDPGTVLVSAASGARAAHTTGDAYVYRKVETRGDEGEARSGWERADDGLSPGETLRPVLARGATSGEFYAASNHGLFRTADAGESWRRLVAWPEGEGFEDQAVRGLAVV